MGARFPKIVLKGDKDIASQYIRPAMQELFKTKNLAEQMGVPVYARTTPLTDNVVVRTEVHNGVEMVHIFAGPPVVETPVLQEEKEVEELLSGCLPGFIVYSRGGAVSPTHWGHHIAMQRDGKWKKVSSNVARGAETYWDGIRWHMDPNNNSPYYTINSPSVQAEFPGLGKCSLITWADNFMDCRPTHKYILGALKEDLAPTVSRSTSLHLRQREFYLAGVQIIGVLNRLIFGVCLLPDTDEGADYIYMLTTNGLPTYNVSTRAYKITGMEVYKLKLTNAKEGFNNWTYVGGFTGTEIDAMGFSTLTTGGDLKAFTGAHITAEGYAYLSLHTTVESPYGNIGTFIVNGVSDPDGYSEGFTTPGGAFAYGANANPFPPAYMGLEVLISFDIKTPATLIRELDAEQDGLYPQGHAAHEYAREVAWDTFDHYGGAEPHQDNVIDTVSPQLEQALEYVNSNNVLQIEALSTPVGGVGGLDALFTYSTQMNVNTLYSISGAGYTYFHPLKNPEALYNISHNYMSPWTSTVNANAARQSMDLIVNKGLSREVAYKLRIWESATASGEVTASLTKATCDEYFDGRKYDWFPGLDLFYGLPWGYPDDQSIRIRIHPTTTTTERGLVFFHPHIPELTAYLERTVVATGTIIDFYNTDYSYSGTLSYYIGSELQWTTSMPVSTSEDTYVYGPPGYEALQTADGSWAWDYGPTSIWSGLSSTPHSNVGASVRTSTTGSVNDFQRPSVLSQTCTFGATNDSNFFWNTYDRSFTKLWSSCAVHPHKVRGKYPYIVYLKNLYPNMSAPTSVWYRPLSDSLIGHESYSLSDSLVYVKASGLDQMDGRDGQFFSNVITLSEMQALVGEDDDFPLSFGVI